MKCSEVNQHLDAWLDQALEPEVAEKVESHISQCSMCRAEIERLQALGAMLRTSEIHQPTLALEERVMSAFYKHHRQPAVRGWRRLIFGTINLPKPAFALMGLIVVAVSFAAFSLGRLTAPRVMLNAPLPTAAIPSTPLIVEVPVERERIVYAPDSRSKTISPPHSTALTAKSSNAPSSLPQPEVQKTSASLASLDDFEPIKGATARVIKGSQQR